MEAQQNWVRFGTSFGCFENLLLVVDCSLIPKSVICRHKSRLDSFRYIRGVVKELEDVPLTLSPQSGRWIFFARRSRCVDFPPRDAFLQYYRKSLHWVFLGSDRSLECDRGIGNLLASGSAGTCGRGLWASNSGRCDPRFNRVETCHVTGRL